MDLPRSLSKRNRLLVFGLRGGGLLTLFAMFGLALACDGFFVDPVLTGMVVGPSATVQTGNTIQLSAVGTYDDGSQKDLSSGLFWDSDSPTVAIVSSSGLVKAIAPGKAVVTGWHKTVSGSANITVTLGGITSIQVTTADGLSGITWGASEQFVATATANGTQIDISDSVTWSTNPRTIANVSISPTGLLTTTSGPTSTNQFVVVALDPTSGIFGQMNFVVHP